MVGSVSWLAAQLNLSLAQLSPSLLMIYSQLYEYYKICSHIILLHVSLLQRRVLGRTLSLKIQISQRILQPCSTVSVVKMS